MMKKLKTFEDACKVLELDPKKVIPDFTCYPEPDRKAAESNSKLMIVIKAANQLENDGKEWVPDWDDGNYNKCFPWFKMGSSGFRYLAHATWASDSHVGSRLCFKTSELCEYISTQFIELYKDIYLK